MLQITYSLTALTYLNSVIFSCFPIWVAGWTACLWTLCFGAFVGTPDWSDWGGAGTNFPPFPVCGKAEMSAAGGEVMVLAETSLDGEGGRATSSASRGSLLEAMAGEAAARAREAAAAAAPDSKEPKPRSLERTERTSWGAVRLDFRDVRAWCLDLNVCTSPAKSTAASQNTSTKTSTA